MYKWLIAGALVLSFAAFSTSAEESNAREDCRLEAMENGISDEDELREYVAECVAQLTSEGAATESEAEVEAEQSSEISLAR